MACGDRMREDAGVASHATTELLESRIRELKIELKERDEMLEEKSEQIKQLQNELVKTILVDKKIIEGSKDEQTALALPKKRMIQPYRSDSHHTISTKPIAPRSTRNNNSISPQRNPTLQAKIFAAKEERSYYKNTIK